MDIKVLAPPSGNNTYVNAGASQRLIRLQIINGRECVMELTKSSCSHHDVLYADCRRGQNFAFGGSARFLGKFGKSVLRPGGQFEEALWRWARAGTGDGRYDRVGAGAGACISRLLSRYTKCWARNPSMFAVRYWPVICMTSSAKELAGGDVAAWLYQINTGSMIPTIVFSIPRRSALSSNRSDRRYSGASGVLAGIVTIPIGCIAGTDAMHSGVQINAIQPVEFTRADPDEHDPGIDRRGAGSAGAEVHPGKNDQSVSRFSPNLVADHHRSGGCGG